jgi:molecular chaperone Hsp33
VCYAEDVTNDFQEEMSAQKEEDAMKLEEYALRAMTNDGAFRAIAIRATETARAIIAAQHAKGFAARRLGELVAGTILVRETMAPRYRVQGIMGGDNGEMRLAADSYPDGGTRGLLRLPAGESDLRWRHLRRLQMMRTLATGEPQQGLVEVAAEGDMSEALSDYMTYSEQVATLLGVGCVIENDQVVAAGGYLVQRLPEAQPDAYDTMVGRVAALPPCESLLVDLHADPTALMRIILQDIPYTELEKSSLGFKCRCSLERVLASLATIGRADIEEMASADQVIEIDCEFCGKSFYISPHQLRGLLIKT